LIKLKVCFNYLYGYISKHLIHAINALCVK